MRTSGGVFDVGGDGGPWVQGCGNAGGWGVVSAPPWGCGDSGMMLLDMYGVRVEER